MDTGDPWWSEHSLGVLWTKRCSHPQWKNTIKQNNRDSSKGGAFLFKLSLNSPPNFLVFFCAAVNQVW